MTVTDQIKILSRKIMQNEAQYNLDRKADTISALSSNNLGKYEYLTGEDLGLKTSTVEQAKFEYSPLGKIFNKGLDKDDQKEGLLDKADIEDKHKKLLKVKNKTKYIKGVTNFITEPLRVKYDFSDYRIFKKLFRDLYYKKLTIEDAEAYQIQFDAVLYHLHKYSSKNPRYIEAKKIL